MNLSWFSIDRNWNFAILINSYFIFIYNNFTIYIFASKRKKKISFHLLLLAALPHSSVQSTLERRPLPPAIIRHHSAKDRTVNREAPITVDQRLQLSFAQNFRSAGCRVVSAMNRLERSFASPPPFCSSRHSCTTISSHSLVTYARFSHPWLLSLSPTLSPNSCSVGLPPVCLCFRPTTHGQCHH